MPKKSPKQAPEPKAPTPKKARPFIKWVGGKNQLGPQIAATLPPKIRTYFEPMVGAGSVFFLLANEKRFKDAVISDVNLELMDVWRALERDPEGLIKILKTYKHNEETFYKVRDLEPTRLPLLKRAARLIFLLKTCFNGLFRVNKRGKFNTSFGRYTNPKICDAPNLLAIHELLSNGAADILTGDFEASVGLAKPGDAVYFDPPYIPRSKTALFTSYSSDKFGKDDHERLALCFRQLAEKGVAVVLTNSDTEETRRLYEGFRMDEVMARRSVSCAAKKRGPVSELIISANCQ